MTARLLHADFADTRFFVRSLFADRKLDFNLIPEVFNDQLLNIGLMRFPNPLQRETVIDVDFDTAGIELKTNRREPKVEGVSA